MDTLLFSGESTPACRIVESSLGLSILAGLFTRSPRYGTGSGRTGARGAYWHLLIGAVAYVEVRSLYPHMSAIARFHQRVQRPAGQQGALYWVLGLAGEEHILEVQAHVDEERMRITM